MMDLNPDFLCVCGHRNKLHASLEDSLAWNGHHIGRMCVEYRDVIYVKGIWYHDREEICACPNFVGDNLLTLEQQSEKVV
jgi:hypothetical protein